MAQILHWTSHSHNSLWLASNGAEVSSPPPSRLQTAAALGMAWRSVGRSVHAVLQSATHRLKSSLLFHTVLQNSYPAVFELTGNIYRDFESNKDEVAWLGRLAGKGGCYSQAALSSNDSNTLSCLFFVHIRLVVLLLHRVLHSNERIILHSVQEPFARKCNSCKLFYRYLSWLKAF